MRKFLRSFVMMALLAVPFISQAQLGDTYLFATGVDNSKWYTLTSDQVVLKEGSGNDSYATDVTNIGFTFVLDGTSYTQFSANSDGTLRFGSTKIGTGSYSTPFSASNANTNAPKVCAFGCDGYLATGDYIKYQLFGTAGNRVLVVEISTGTYTSSTRNNHYTFQIQLAEADNSITLVYSPVAPAAAPAVAHQLGIGVSSSNFVLFDNTNHTMTAYTAGTSTTNASGTWPDAGRFYTIYPNPDVCYGVGNLAATNLTTNSATLTWTDEMNEGATYTVKNGDAVLASGLTSMSYNITGLTANTQYTYTVIANCSSTSESSPRYVTFTTLCDDLTTLPYEQDFEAAATGSSTGTTFVECMTRLNNGSQYFGYPYVGSSSYNHTTGGAKGLYWSCSTTSGTYGDYQYVVLPGIDPTVASINTLWLKFWAKATSASYHPKFEVGVMTAPNEPATFEKIADVNVEGTAWTEFTTLLASYTGTGKFVAIRALRPTTTWNAAVDDITLEVAPACLPVVNVAASTTVGAATITWDYFPGANAPAGYEVNYKEAGAAGDGTTVTATTNSTLITGLNAATSYEVKVRATCGTDGNGDWSEVTTFMTGNLPCTDGNFAEVTIGDGTYTSNGYIPTYVLYEYSYTQQIFTPTEINASGVVNSISLHAYTIANANRNIEIYMGHVDDATATSFLNPADLTLVWSGTTDFVAGEWNTFNLTTPFNYDGVHNLLVVFRDMTGTWSGTNYFYGTQTTSGVSRYIYQDGTPYSIAPSGGTASDFRPNMQMSIGACNAYATCAAPVAELDSVNETEASVSWIPGYNETSWTVSYRDEFSTDWTVAAADVTAMNYTFTGLTPATAYEFRVQPGCSTDTTFAAVVTAATACSSVTLPYSIDFERPAAINCWSAVTNEANPIFRATDDEDRTVIVMSSYNSVADGNYNQYLISPSFTSTEPVKLTFSSYAYGTGDSIQVLYTTSTLSNLVAATEMTSNSEYHTDTVYLPAETKQVVFHYNGNFAYYYFIDNINIEARPQNTVTLNILNIEGTSEAWGTVANTGLTVYEGDSVAFTSTPGEYKRTAAWYAVADTTGVAPVAIDTNEFAIRVTSDTTVTVLFGYGQFRIAAVPNQERMGSVEADPASANNMYDYLSEVTLTATAADGFMFKEWLNVEDNSVFSTDNPLNLTAIENYDLKARFVIDTFHITIVTENGTVNGADQGYMFGEVATITAVADEHYEFYYWADTVDGVSISADETLSFRMLGDTTFYPVFGPLQYTVAIDGDPSRATYVIKHGDVENLAGAGEYTYGDTLTVIARDINTNYDWMGWKVGDETVTTDTAYTFVLEDNITFFANIPGGMYTMTFATNDMDMGSVKIDSVRLEDGTVIDYADSTTLTVTLNYGSIIYATATPVSQYAQFNGWSHGTPDLMALSAAFNVVNDTTVYANFGFQTYNVTVNIYPDVLVGEVAVSPAAPEYGETVTLTATAAAHWVFDHWTDANDNTIGTDLSYTSDLLFEDMVYNAYFVRDSHNVVAIVEDATYGTTLVTDADGNEAIHFMHTDMATVAFTEGYGYTFAGWSNGTDIVSTDNPYTFEVEDDVELTATVDPIIYNVNVLVAEGQLQRGTASTSTPTVAYLGIATLANEPNYGYVFDFWANEAGDEIELPLVITQDTTIVAHFTFDQFTVTGAPHADCVMMGTVAPATGEYDYLSTATLTATANYGYHFVKWVDAANVELGTAETIDITVAGDSNIFAMFDYEPMDIVVNVNDPLFGTAATTVAAPYFFSQTITVEATAAEHYHFVNWTNANGEDVSNDNPYTFILTEPVELTANFAIDTHTVTLVYNENAVEEIHGDGEYTYGSDVEVGLTPAYGFTFTGWDNGETTNPFTLHVESDTTVEALFSTNQYTVTAALGATSTGMGTAGGTNTVDYMSYVILTATPATGHDFVNWTNADGEVASTDLSFYVQATQDTTFYANFKVHAYTVTIASADEERGDVAWSAPTHIETLLDQTGTFSNGTNTNGYVPVYGFYADAYLRSQFVYPAEMLADINGGVISQMTFYASQTSVTSIDGDWTVKLMEIPTSTLSGFQDVSAATTVYSGTVAIASNQMVIPFSSNYTYNGGNLLVEFVQTSESSSYPTTTFYGVNTTGASVQGYSYSSVSAITANNRAFLPKVTFTYDIDAVVLDPITGVAYDETDPNHIAYVDYQHSIAMEATPEYGYHFENWTNSLDATTSTDNPMTVASIEADVDYTANFGKNQYTITAAVGGDNEGTVSGTATVDYLETVTLTATPNADHRLLRWVNANNDVLGTSETITITAERDSVITAIFGYQVYTLTANTEDFEMGGVYVEDPNGIAEFTATIADGTVSNSYVPFEGWNADGAQHNQMIYPATDLAALNGGTISKMVFYIDQSASNGSYTAADRLGTWTVSLGETDATTLTGLDNTTVLTQVYNGNFDCSTGLLTLEFATPYNYNGGNLLVDLNHAASGYNRWYFLGIEATGASYTRNAQRNFLPKVQFTYQMAGNVPSLESSYADVDYTTNVNIYATPAEHYHFVGWMNEAGDTVTALGVNANPTITVLGDSTLTALFDGDQMPMTYQVNSAVRGSVEGPATGEFNTEVEFEAIAAHGYEFTQWEDGIEDNPRTVVVKGTAEENTYKAIFSFQTFDVDVAVENGTLANELDTRNIYYGTQLTIEAVADEHYSNWKGWKDSEGNVVTTENPFTFIVLEDVNLTGVFEIDSVDYTFASNDVTMGTVTSSIEAGRYAYNTEVTLAAAVADADHHFVDWNDGETATERTVVLTQDTDLVANFALNQYNVAAVAVNGTVEWATDPATTANVTPVDPHTNLTFTATPDAGYNFVNWTDNDGNIISSVNPFIVEIVSDTTLVANFGTEVYTVVAISTDTVKGTVSPATANLTVEQGALLTATPKYGYVFVNWTDKTGAEISTAAEFTFTDVTMDTVYANFNYDWFDITAATNNATYGSVMLDGSTTVLTKSYPYGDTANLTAVANAGYVFVRWDDGITATSRRVIVEATTTYTAIFADNTPITITATVDDAAHGTATVSGDNNGYFLAGDVATITAIEYPNYLFAQWQDGNTDNPRQVNVTQDSTFTAYFDTVAYTVTIDGTAQSVKYGLTATAEATVAACQTFAGWSDGTTIVSTANPYTFTVTGDITLTSTVEIVTLTGEETQVACGSYEWHGQSYTTSGDYTWTDASNCDSVATLHLTINASVAGTSTSQAICAGESYTWNNTEYTAANTYYYDYTDANGCAVQDTLVLTVNTPAAGTTTAQAICAGETYTWNTIPYSVAGTYTNATTDVNGCSVVDTLVLTVSQASSTTVPATACGSYFWSNTNETYTTSGIYYDTLTNANGCDSVVTLALTINQPVYSSVTESACGSYTWTNGNGQTYTTSGTYTATVSGGAANGCDSIITLNLTVNQGATDTVTESACDSYNWNGTDYTTSGTYTWNGTASNGCDSTVTLNLTVNQSVADTVTETVEENLVWNGMTLTTSGTYTWTGVAANGCDSVVTLILTVTGSVTPDTNYYTVYVETVNGGFGTVTGDGTYPEGTVVTLIATPINADEYEFVAWLINGDTAWTNPEYTFTLVSDTTVTAVFAQLPVYYTVNAIVVDEDGNVNDAMGTVLPAGSHQVEAGTYDTLTAQANPGYHFVRWNNGHNQPTIVILVTGDITLEAIFAADQPVNGIDENDMENVTIYSAESTIFVRGAEGKDVSVYDINGRTISSQMSVGETVEFRMAATGVYLVKVGDAPAKRVLVVR